MKPELGIKKYFFPVNLFYVFESMAWTPVLTLNPPCTLYINFLILR